jgi:hypothetical protein
MTNTQETTVRVGDRVRLRPLDGNPFLDGAAGTVEELTAYGAVVRTSSAATGHYRAVAAELVPDAPQLDARDAGFTGDFCALCGSMQVVRNGACLLCVNCGSTNGCS